MKKAIFYMIAGAVLLIILISLVPEQETIPEVTTPEVTTSVVQQDVYKEEYMMGCVNDPTYYDYCECTYDYLKLTIGVEGIVRLGLEIEDPDDVFSFPEEFKDAIIYCADQL